jgi:hypothetical protein
VPPPRFHTLRYFGVLSSHSSRRALVVPCAPPDPTSTKPPPAAGDQLDLLDQLGERDDKPSTRKRWAWLLARIFAADVETCPRCAGPMRWAEVATSRADITRLLHEQGPTSQTDITRLLHEHGLGPRAPPSRPRRHRVPEQLSLGFREV